MRQDIESAIEEALAALRSAVQDGYHEMAHTYSSVIAVLHGLLRDL